MNIQGNRVVVEKSQQEVFEFLSDLNGKEKLKSPLKRKLIKEFNLAFLSQKPKSNASNHT